MKRYSIKYKVDNWLFDTNFQHDSKIDALIDLKQCLESSENKFYVIDNVKDVEVKPTLLQNIVVKLRLLLGK